MRHEEPRTQNLFVLVLQRKNLIDDFESKNDLAKHPLPVGVHSSREKLVRCKKGNKNYYPLFDKNTVQPQKEYFPA